MAIKNMDDIYRRAKRIVAVPDLCYCAGYPLMEDVTREDIEAAIIHMCKARRIGHSDNNALKALVDTNEAGTYTDFRLDVDELLTEMEPWNEGNNQFLVPDYYSDMIARLGKWWEGDKFIDRVVNEWAERAWVVSERTIGVNGRKLLIHIVRANAVINWKLFGGVDWSFDFNQYALVKTILQSKSTKPIDRLFAILPHTKYKNAVQKSVDEETTINDEEDLEWLLFDILDTQGKDDLLDCLADKHTGLFRRLPLSTQETEFWPCEESLLGDHTGDWVIFQVQHTATGSLKVVLTFVYPRSQLSNNVNQLLNVADSQEMKLVCQFKGFHYRWLYIICRKSNGSWKIAISGLHLYHPYACKYDPSLMVWKTYNNTREKS
ncbi:hypothetical protein EC973_003706 [Apophysomyces ossiformis]|uniref:Uncharacterized protein n=1 Tax=Apophysomyces ossiformis TaxID=679940 RepID=A0A8H7EKZ4_9FUNG|nr:hypothetical protein EC973_003706 [Apophysomyces ossiformis]